ncbi:MAG TPA: ThuA domain-containing protein [Pirellulales bacterium]|jgi:type 1 glutamine amidotransferase|nr:ThuA domain-containing protein [Pirellulales bacterium]
MIRFISFWRAILLVGLALVLGIGRSAHADQPWVVYDGGDGPGRGKQIVLVSGDEEYRSEEGLPQLGKILAKRHGFKCTVLFSVDPKDGTINPNLHDNIPGLEALDSADLMIILTRFRSPPDEQMKHIAEYVNSGRPIIGLRTATHAFDIPDGKTYAKYGWHSKQWDGGFGRQILGETWINHHGQHGKQSTLGIVAPGAENHPILRGIKSGDIWCPTDVYAVRLPLPSDCQPLVLGEVLEGMKQADKPVAGKQNDPMMPVAWAKTYTSASGKSGRVFTTTMGASQDLLNEPLRRLIVNACYWAVGLEDKLPEKANVELVGDYSPTAFKFDGYKRGVTPSDMRESP